MSMRNTFGIYQVLTQLLQKSKHPLTSVELFDSPDVRQYAEDVNKVSDYLGHMFRRGFLNRVPSRGIGMAKWAYSWKDPEVGTPAPTPPIARKAQPRLVLRKVGEAPPTLANGKPKVRLIDNHDGTVTVEFSVFTLTIAAR